MMNKFTLLIGGLAMATTFGVATPSLANSGCVAANYEILIDKTATGKERADLPFCANMNNGWGNGDQAAPGSSLLVNNAENNCTDDVLCESTGNGDNTRRSPSNSPNSG
ncbi:hypothetical protein [Loktanella sp. 5RATIMAR09]|uniref:hypothetical protein n=1 Tax=Loktanella sp. 5RATIMAR09 TaxID=1225655 RepID=UPI000B1D132C|nr:hypothetical protein [Loktanella sp. 5RATIMAR09]